MRFIIQGKVKPAVRMTRRGKFVRKDAQEYLKSQGDIKTQITATMSREGYWPIPDQTPFIVRITIEMPGRLHRQDLDNQTKALVDAAQKIAFTNDLWMDELSAVRWLGQKYQTVMEIESL